MTARQTTAARRKKAAATGRTARLSIYEALRSRIVTAQLKPGQKLSDRLLAGELGVSRTPVREALYLLEQEGLVARDTRAGYFVREMDSKEIADLYSLREALEVHAFALAADRASASDFDQLDAVIQAITNLGEDRTRRGEEIRVGLEIHLIIAQASGNAPLQDALSRLLDRMMSVIWLEMVNEDQKQQEATRSEHVELVRALKDRRVQEGQELIRRHIQQAREHITRVLDAKDLFYSHTVERGAG